MASKRRRELMLEAPALRLGPPGSFGEDAGHDVGGAAGHVGRRRLERVEDLFGVAVGATELGEHVGRSLAGAVGVAGLERLQLRHRHPAIGVGMEVASVDERLHSGDGQTEDVCGLGHGHESGTHRVLDSTQEPAIPP